MNITIPKIFEKNPPLPTVGVLAKGLVLTALSAVGLPYMSPVGIAFAATFPSKQAYLALIGIAAGMAGQGHTALKYILSYIIYYVLIHINNTDSKKARALFLALALSAGGVISLLWSHASLFPALMLIPEAVASGALFCLFTLSGGKSSAARVADIAMLGFILNGISGITIPHINADVSILAAVFICLCLCRSCEPTAAVTASAALGFIMRLADSDAVMLCGGFAICAAAASSLSDMGRLVSAVGFLCGITVTALLCDSLDGLSPTAVFISAAGFVILPDAVHRKISHFINSRLETEYEQPEESSRIADRLKTVARAVCDLGEGVTVASALPPSDTEDIIEAVAARVCQSCYLYKNCWKKDSPKTYENMYEIMQTMERDGFCDYTNMPLSFKQVCLKSESFLCEFKHVYELSKQSLLLSGEAGAGRSIMARQYGEIAKAIELISEDIENGCDTEYAPQLRYRLEITCENEPKPGQSACGDTLIHFGRGSKYFVILCDGMGSGDSAMTQSRLAARLFEEFLKAGFEKHTAVSMINSALALKADQESFSTADILEVDLETGTAEFLKIGSAQSFLKTRNGIEVISSKALPIGILEKITAEPEQRELDAGDMILMISDGIGEAGTGVLKNEWIKKLLISGNRRDSELAKLIMMCAKARTRFCDDMTCCIIRVKKNKE